MREEYGCMFSDHGLLVCWFAGLPVHTAVCGWNGWVLVRGELTPRASRLRSLPCRAIAICESRCAICGAHMRICHMRRRASHGDCQ